MSEKQKSLIEEFKLAISSTVKSIADLKILMLFLITIKIMIMMK